jgi:hypothetical protein
MSNLVNALNLDHPDYSLPDLPDAGILDTNEMTRLDMCFRLHETI